MVNDQNIETLLDLNDALTETKAHELHVIDKPLAAIENRLSDFVQDSFRCIEENREFENRVQQEIESRLPEASFQQLINLLEVRNKGNTADMTGIVNPFAAASAAKAQAEIAQGINVNQTATQDKVMYDKANKDLLQGLAALNQLLDKAQTAASNKEDQ